jgi:hypothetical protein
MWSEERQLLDAERLRWLGALSPYGSRHGIDCWHGSPRRPLDGFLTPKTAALALLERPVGSLGLVGHTHDPILFISDGVQARGLVPTPGSPVAIPDGGVAIANPGAVVGGRTDPATWWLEVDTDARVLTWHRRSSRL